MIISKESNITATGGGNSKQTTIPIMLCELLRIEAGDKLVWTINGADDEPVFEVKLLRKEYI
jgi:bifunctional DNA-binding transcriptional regulator/antitoxin component of YhaV-PrlF toxin-antitoxin module